MKTILITGASRRLGFYLTEQFLAQGDQVLALTREPSVELTKLDAKNAMLHVFVLQNYTEANIDSTLTVIRQKFTKIDLIVHNASAFYKNTEYSSQQFGEFFQVHMAMPAQINETLRDHLYDENKPSVIIHITDIYAENPNKEYVLYCATKAGLENLTKGYAKKFAPGVRVLSIQPGPIQFMDSHTDEEKAQVMQETLLPSEGGFQPILLAIKSAIDNPYMTGSCIKVDGGRSLSGR
ncbi:MAG: SDR family NAD(P)-dependent oxidoreductase [Agarilytica sp.]